MPRVPSAPLAGRRAPAPGPRARCWAALAGGALALAAGCVRVPVKPGAAVESTLVCATANGQTTLSWQSRTNLVYTVLVAEQWSALRWEALPACTRQRGTGGLMEYVVPEQPGRTRTYKLLAAPLSPPPKR